MDVSQFVPVPNSVHCHNPDERSQCVGQESVLQTILPSVQVLVVQGEHVSQLSIITPLGQTLVDVPGMHVVGQESVLHTILPSLQVLVVQQSARVEHDDPVPAEVHVLVAVSQWLQSDPVIKPHISIPEAGIDVHVLPTHSL